MHNLSIAFSASGSSAGSRGGRKRGRPAAAAAEPEPEAGESETLTGSRFVEKVSAVSFVPNLDLTNFMKFFGRKGFCRLNRLRHFSFLIYFY
jgi:hypothetical protein